MENEEDIKKNYKVTSKDNFLVIKKFRVFDKKEHKWIDEKTCSLCLDGTKLIINNKEFNIKEGEENRFDIMQFSGYIRNDIKIFEGDYLKTTFVPAIYEVRMTPNCLFCLEVKACKRWTEDKKRKNKDLPYFLNYGVIEFEVVGNKYDTNLDDIMVKEIGIK